MFDVNLSSPGAVCTLASPLTAPWRQIQQTAAAEFPNARVVQSTTNPSTTTWLEGPHQHPMPLMWSPLDPITLSTVLMRLNQVPAIHSHHQEVILKLQKTNIDWKTTTYLDQLTIFKNAPLIQLF